MCEIIVKKKSRLLQSYDHFRLITLNCGRTLLPIPEMLQSGKILCRVLFFYRKFISIPLLRLFKTLFSLYLHNYLEESFAESFNQYFKLEWHDKSEKPKEALNFIRNKLI